MRDRDDSSTPTPVTAVILAGATGLALALLLVSTALTMSSREAVANPAIAQKTGQPCGKCHAGTPPALNSYGKSYKAKGR